MNEHVCHASTEMAAGRDVRGRECGMLRVHRAVQRYWLARSRTGNVRSDLTFRQRPNIVVLCVPSKRGYSVEAF